MKLIFSRYRIYLLFLIWVFIFQTATGSVSYGQTDPSGKEKIIPYTQELRSPGNLESIGSYSKNPSIIDASRQFYEVLPNGFKIVVQERPGTGVVSAILIIKTGVIEEMDTYPGITTVLQALMLRGGGKDKFIPLQELAEADGCIMKSSAKTDYAYILLMATKDTFRTNLKRLFEVLKAPLFDEEALKEEKQKLIFNIENNRTSYQFINEIFLESFYRYHPYRQPIYGNKNTVAKLDLSKIKEYYTKNYCANRMTLAICGDIEGSDILELCKSQLSDIPRGEYKNLDILWEPVGQEKKVYLSTASNLAWIYVGFPAPGMKSPDYPAMKIIQSILGEGLSSRLFIELREKEGLAYELDANYPELEGPSHMLVYVVTNLHGLRKSRKKIFEEINNLKKTPLTEEELDAVKRKILGKYLVEREDSAGRALNLAYVVAIGMGRNYDEAIMRKIQSVTSQDVQNVARKYLDNFTVLVVEPPGGTMQYW